MRPHTLNMAGAGRPLARAGRLGLALGLSLASLLACKSGNPNLDDTGGMPDAATGGEPDMADARGTICADPVKKSIDATGGKLSVGDGDGSSLAGTTLLVPAGAVATPTVLGITCGRELATGADEQAAGPSARFLPLSQILLSTVTITLPYNPSLIAEGERPKVAVLRGTQRDILPDGELQVDKTTKTVSFDTAEFGDFEVIGRKVAPPGPTSAVDILFVVDNSPSMSPKQKALAANISALIQKLEKNKLSYHIGVVSSDIGTQVAPGTPWGGSIGACDSYAGDDGLLQNQACTMRTGGTPGAREACAANCSDGKFVPTDGSRYISRVDGKSNVPVAMELDPESGMMVDRGPEKAFKCMALLGDSGCGIESPLESARRALDGHRSENTGFLRKDSFLAVVFLTDEDDCSVQLSRRSENNPMTRDCSTPDPEAAYDCFGLDYRCLARSVRCDQPMNTAGTKTNCKERTDNYLDPVSKFVSFFKALRPADKLFVSGIWTQPALDGGGKLVVSRGSGGTTSAFLNRAGGTDASCFYAADSTIFGQAQRRLSSFARGFSGSREFSICDIDGLNTALGQVGQTIIDRSKK